MLGFLGHNVGDHLGAAVANVLADGRRHFEQAVFADELSAQSIEAMRESIAAQWRAISATLVPQLEKLIDADRAAGRPQDQRLRVGLFSYSERMLEPAAPARTDPRWARPPTHPPPQTPKEHVHDTPHPLGWPHASRLPESGVVLAAGTLTIAVAALLARLRRRRRRDRRRRHRRHRLVQCRTGDRLRVGLRQRRALRGQRRATGRRRRHGQGARQR